MGACCERWNWRERARDRLRGKRCEAVAAGLVRGEGQREERGEMSVVSQSTMRRSSQSMARRGGLVDDGEEKEKSSNMVILIYFPFWMLIFDI